MKDIIHNTNPTLQDYFHALNTYFVGDIKVFDKNCELADRAKEYINPTLETSLKILMQDDPPAYSSIYSNPGSHVMASYLQNPNPRLTIPLALTLFSAMELLGIFYTGRTDPGSTTENLISFFKKTPVSVRQSPENLKKLIKIYRHGLAHQYFAKEQYSLSYSFLDPPQLFFGENQQCLNINYLNKIFLLGFDEIQKDIENYPIMETNVRKMLNEKRSY
jgi:hypothetical protein